MRDHMTLYMSLGEETRGKGESNSQKCSEWPKLEIIPVLVRSKAPNLVQ